MARKFLQMFSGSCRHEFAWPRRSASGEYYQVCLRCGEEYQYDWQSMTRLGKRNDSAQPVAPPAAERQSGRKPSWSPRARRLKSPIPAQFRPQGESEFREATIENISQSGLFVRAENAAQEQEVLEMIFEMPVEISGQKNAKVLCMGKVVRVSPQKESAVPAFAVSILDYHFLHTENRKKSGAQPMRAVRRHD